MTQYWKLTGRGGSSNFILVLKKDRALLASYPAAPLATLKPLLDYWLAHSQEQQILRAIDKAVSKALSPSAPVTSPTVAQLKNRLLHAFQFGGLFASEFKYATRQLEEIVLLPLKNVPATLKGEALQVEIAQRVGKLKREDALALVRSGKVPDLANIENPGKGSISVVLPASQYALLVRAAGSKPGLGSPAPTADKKSTLRIIKPGTRGFIISKDGSNLRTVPYELDRNAPFEVKGVLPPGTPVVVIGHHPQKPEWLQVSACVQRTVVRGYVQHFRVTTELPEPTATLHFVQQGERLEPIAARSYRQGIEPGRDLRFYENVILYVNEQYRQKGVRKVDGDVQLVAGEFIWLVSVDFANRLEKVVKSGSITGGLFARVRQMMHSLADILTSVQMAPDHVGEVFVGEYGKAILEHLPVLIGTVVLFLSLECLSAALAVSPTGVGQLAAAVIQLGLAAVGAEGLVQAGVAATKYAMLWLRTAWTARGNPQQLAEASKYFLHMLASIALAALGFLGMKGNLTKGLSLAKNVRISPPQIEWMAVQGSHGGTVAVPVFKRGSITTTKEMPVAPKLQIASEASAESEAAAAKTKTASPKETPAKNPPKEVPLTDRPLSDAKLEQLMEKVQNWEGLKDLVGRRVPKPGTSEFIRFEGKLKQAGYQMVKDSEGQLGYVRRLPGKAKGNEYAQLTMTEEGLIALKTGGGTRISVFSRYRKNFLDLVKKEYGDAACAEAAARISQGKSQLHHLIPDGVAQKNLLIREAYERLTNYTIDRGSNMIDMPSAIEHVDDELYVHLGSHKNYSNHVDDLLTKELRGLTQGGKTLLRDVKIESIERAIKKVEDLLHKQIKNGGLPDKVIKELIEDGIPVKVKGKPVYKLAMLQFRPEGTELVA